MQIVQTRLCPITVPLNFACVENNGVSVLFAIQITELTFVKFYTERFFLTVCNSVSCCWHFLPPLKHLKNVLLGMGGEITKLERKMKF